jgi:hypothetical protein
LPLPTSSIVISRRWGLAISPKRAFLADDLRFEGPIDRFDRADDFMKEITEHYGMVKGVDHQAKIADGDEVAVLYILDTPLAKAPVARVAYGPGREDRPHPSLLRRSAVRRAISISRLITCR